jgi:hypothetical protein
MVSLASDISEGPLVNTPDFRLAAVPQVLTTLILLLNRKLRASAAMPDLGRPRIPLQTFEGKVLVASQGSGAVNIAVRI